MLLLLMTENISPVDSQKEVSEEQVGNFLSNMLRVNTMHFTALLLVTVFNVGQWHNAKIQFSESISTSMQSHMLCWLNLRRDFRIPKRTD